MKKVIILLIFLPGIIFSNNFHLTESENYIFKSESNINIQNIIDFSEEFNKKIDDFLLLSTMKEKREILVFDNLNNYNNYLTNLGLEQREDYVFITFSDNRSKVVLYKTEEISQISLSHHLTLQYLDTFAKGAPSWFNIGIATYFEDLNSTKWISLLKNSINTEHIFTTIKNSNIKNIKPYQTWLLFDFLINTENKNYIRLLWETISFLKYSNSADKDLFISNNFSKYNLDNELYQYLMNKQSYKDYMDDGIEFYQKKEFNKAIEKFTQAIIIEPNLYSPEYYLALCFSGLSKYSEAYSHFSLSLDKKAPVDTVYYSIGLNFFADKKFDEAKKYLSKIEDKMYKEMAKEVLNEISKY